MSAPHQCLLPKGRGATWQGDRDKEEELTLGWEGFLGEGKLYPEWPGGF